MFKKLGAMLFPKADDIMDTGVRVLQKVTGTDFPTADRAEWLLRYQEATKGQSPARRAIALVIVGEHALLLLVWMVSMILGHSMGWAASLLIAGEVKAFLESNINMALNILLSFYFIAGMRK